MKEAIVHRCYRVLSRRELASFEEFLLSPFFNKSEKQLELYRLLISPLKKGQYKVLSKRELHFNLFPEKAFNDGVIRKILSIHFRLLKQFLSLKDRKEENYTLALLKQLRKRKDLSIHEIEIKKAERTVANSKYQDDEFYFFQHELATERENLIEQKDIRQTTDELQLRNDSLDTFYLIRKLKLLCEMINRGQIINKSYELYFREEIEQLVRKQQAPYLEIPAVQLYWHVFLSLSHPKDEGYFTLLVKQLQLNGKVFSASEQRNLYRYAQNFCIRKINQGEEQFLRSLFEIYNTLIDSRLIVEEKSFPHSDFKNIVTVALRLKEFDWAVNFIETYKTDLPKNLRENAYRFNLASYYYETKQLDKVIESLLEVKFTDVYYDISSRYLLIKTYFDQNEDYTLHYQLLAFERFVSRSKQISGSNKKAIRNFLLILKKLLKLRENSIIYRKEEYQEKLAKLKQRIEAKNPIANKNWLLGKIND